MLGEVFQCDYLGVSHILVSNPSPMFYKKAQSIHYFPQEELGLCFGQLSYEALRGGATPHKISLVSLLCPLPRPARPILVLSRVPALNMLWLCGAGPACSAAHIPILCCVDALSLEEGCFYTAPSSLVSTFQLVLGKSAYWEVSGSTLESQSDHP